MDPTKWLVHQDRVPDLILLPGPVDRLTGLLVVFGAGLLLRVGVLDDVTLPLAGTVGRAEIVLRVGVNSDLLWTDETTSIAPLAVLLLVIAFVVKTS